MAKIQSITTETLSLYRTRHKFEKYAEFHSLEEFQDYYSWAKKTNSDLYILGNGSNTLFGSAKVRSLILKNSLPQDLEIISQGKIRVSSSTLVMDVLKYCHKNSLDSFYYLASVPATIGGALAMNAGRGRAHGLSIYDFVESVRFFDCKENCIKTLGKQEIVEGYRKTIFTGIQSSLILGAVLSFENIVIEGNPILDRRRWSKENQDYSAPNCGSVFKQADPKILNDLKGLKIGHTSFSSKTKNWILNKSKSHFPILVLIRIAKMIHLIRGKKVSTEVIIVK